MSTHPLQKDVSQTPKGKAFAYFRTSAAVNVGPDKDSEARQRAAVEAFAKAQGITIAGEFYDAAVSGSDPVAQRKGFAAMLAAIAGNGVRTVIVETPDRFARDLMVQLAGHDMLKKMGVSLIAASAPQHFLEDTPTAVLVRQVLGAVAQFQKAETVARLTAARIRTGRTGGQRPITRLHPEASAAARSMRGQTLRAISARLADQGFVSTSGKPFAPSTVASMLRA